MRRAVSFSGSGRRTFSRDPDRDRRRTGAVRPSPDWWVAEPVDQDQRILLVPYTPGNIAATAKRSPLDRAILARALTNIDKMGAKAIGIDILIDQPQPEDAQLLAALRAMKTPVWLAYATSVDSGDEIELWQQQFMDDWFRQLAGSQVRPTSIRFEPDGDNVLRRWPSLPPGLPPFMPVGARRRSSRRSTIREASISGFRPIGNRRVSTASTSIVFADPAIRAIAGRPGRRTGSS